MNPAPTSPARGIVDPTASESWSFGMSVREILDLPLMESADVLAGVGGLDRVVDRLNMMEVPDVLPWVRPGEMLVTSGYPLRDLTEQELARLVRDLAGRGLAGMCVKLGRFVAELAPSVIDAADTERFTLVSMPTDLSFTDLLGAVLGEQLDRQEAALRASDEIDRLLLKILVDGGGHQDIAASVAGWLGVPVTITDADGLVAGTAPDPNRERLEVRSIPYDEDDVLASGNGMTVACIRSGATVQGYLVADTRGNQLTVGQSLALRRAAPVVALAFARASEVAAVEARYRGDFLRAVIAGTVRADQDVHGHARRLGWVLDGELVVGVGEPADARPDAGSGAVSARIARVLDSELRRRWPGAAVHGYASEVVAIMPADARDQLDAVMRTARAHLSGVERGFGFGISRVADDIGGVPTAYRQAREALLVAMREQQGTGFTSFDNIGLARLVAVMAESDQAHAVVADALQPLLSDRNGDELLATFESFLSHNCNVAATARELHFHYNTVRYRVSRIEELLGPFVDDAERRAELMAACRLRKALQRRL